MTFKFRQFSLIYYKEDKQISIQNQDFSQFEHEDFVLEFLLEADEDKNATIYTVELMPKQAIRLVHFSIEIDTDYANTFGVFANGFQSWTESRVYYKDDVIKPAKKFIKGLAYTYGDYNFVNYKKHKGCIHSWNYTYIKQEKYKINLLASLNETNAYTLFEHDMQNNSLRISKEIEDRQVAEKFELLHFVSIEDREDFAFQNFAFIKSFKTLKVQPSIGWTSWYNYYTKIDEQIILDNLENFTQNNIPISIFQIDDGWQNAVGDWLNIQPKFKNGMQFIADKIKSKNITAGLWLAPFACEKNSFIFREKQDWVLKDKTGKLIKIGYNPMWSGWFYALDFFNEELRDYLRKVFDTILNEWHFDLVKLDFLYGTASIPQHGKSRGEVMHLVMNFLRECVGDKKILGCGVPLSAAQDTTDFCRIGPDIHLSWEFKLLKLLNARERLSTYSAIHNTISRRHLNQLGFINDPDVFILRKEKNNLNFNEQYSLLLANLLFGDLLFTSDDISKYNEETLFLYKSIFPLVEKESVLVQQEKEFYQIHFNIGDKYYLALINTANHDKIYKLPNGSFFDNVTQNTLKGNKGLTIPKHSSKCLFRINATPFTLVGSKGHFFCGVEVDNIFISGGILEIEWNKKLVNKPIVYYRIPISYEISLSENTQLESRTEDADFAIIALSPK